MAIGGGLVLALDCFVHFILNGIADFESQPFVLLLDCRELCRESGQGRLQVVQVGLSLLEALLLGHQHRIYLVHLGDPALK